MSCSYHFYHLYDYVPNLLSYHYYVLILASPAVLSRYVYVVLVGYRSYHRLRRLYCSYHRLRRLYWFDFFFPCSFSLLRANLFSFFGHELYYLFYSTTNHPRSHSAAISRTPHLYYLVLSISTYIHSTTPSAALVCRRCRIVLCLALIWPPTAWINFLWSGDVTGCRR